MNKHALTSLLSLFNELEDLFSGFICSIKKDLRFLIHPEKGQIDYSHVLPQVAHLFTSAIDNMRYLICNNKFLVLFKDEIRVNMNLRKDIQMNLKFGLKQIALIGKPLGK